MQPRSGRYTLPSIEKRCAEIYPESNDEIANVKVVMVAYFGQLAHHQIILRRCNSSLRQDYNINMRSYCNSSFTRDRVIANGLNLCTLLETTPDHSWQLQNDHNCNSLNSKDVEPHYSTSYHMDGISAVAAAVRLVASQQTP